MNIALRVEIVRQYRSNFKFALAVKVHESYVSRVVNEKRFLHDKEKARWARALRVKVEDIFPS